MKEFFQKLFGLTEEDKLNAIKEEAKEAVTLTDINNYPFICVEGTPVFMVAEKSDAENYTISINQVDACLKKMRENYVSTHKDRRRV